MTTDPGQQVVRTQPLEAVTGVQLMQGIGVPQARGFWADAWSQVLKRPAAVCGLVWVGVITFCAVFAPILANGHPLIMETLDAQRHVVSASSPLLRSLTPMDVLLLLTPFAGLPCLLLRGEGSRVRALRLVLAGFVSAMIVAMLASIAQAMILGRDPTPWLKTLRDDSYAGFKVGLGAAAIVACLGLLVPLGTARLKRVLVLLIACSVAGAVVWRTWEREPDKFDYRDRQAAGQVRAVYTLVPFSPDQRYSELNRRRPLSTLGAGLGLKSDAPGADHTFVLGTDAFGADVFTQILHASRLSISIGVVSTGIALLIGVTMGAIMGYFGGWVDLMLYRIVEVFMAVPVLFLLIVAVAVLPTEWRNTYVMMAIIGCFTWTNMARYTRAEFLKLRNQDFVQAARAVGLPLRSILFRHMLPNGVAPVLVDTSFSIAAAINIEAVLSYLNLGPIGQASWGKLLSSAISAEGEFKWWLAVFPGLAIFLTVLAYNLIGEALRDAIDPKLKKARV